MTLQTWSKTAASNNTADTTINWREGQAPSTVNNSARAMMAAIAKWRDDTSGSLLTTGSSTAYAVTTNEGYTTLIDGLRLMVQVHTANGAAATFAPDGLTAKPLRTHTATALPSASFNSGGLYELCYSLDDDCWYVEGYFSVAALAVLSGNNTFTGTNTFQNDVSITDVTSIVTGSVIPLTLRRSETSGDRTVIDIRGGDGSGTGAVLAATNTATALSALKLSVAGTEIVQFQSTYTQFSQQVAAPTTATLTDAATVTWNWATGQNATLSISADRALALPSNARTGATGMLHVTATGANRSLTLAAGYTLANGYSSPLTIVSGSKNLLSVWYDGTNYWIIPNLQATTTT